MGIALGGCAEHECGGLVPVAAGVDTGIKSMQDNCAKFIERAAKAAERKGLPKRPAILALAA